MSRPSALIGYLCGTASNLIPIATGRHRRM